MKNFGRKEAAYTPRDEVPQEQAEGTMDQVSSAVSHEAPQLEKPIETELLSVEVSLRKLSQVGGPLAIAYHQPLDRVHGIRGRPSSNSRYHRLRSGRAKYIDYTVDLPNMSLIMRILLVSF